MLFLASLAPARPAYADRVRSSRRLPPRCAGSQVVRNLQHQHRAAKETCRGYQVQYPQGVAHLSSEGTEMLTNEMKRQVFLKLRSENYRASLRLEGLVQRPVDADKPAIEQPSATIKTKNVR